MGNYIDSFFYTVQYSVHAKSAVLLGIVSLVLNCKYALPPYKSTEGTPCYLRNPYIARSWLPTSTSHREDRLREGGRHALGWGRGCSRGHIQFNPRRRNGMGFFKHVHSTTFKFHHFSSKKYIISHFARFQ
jgi:hypothetical protein